MANYNPNSPYILGQEWVPIQEDDYSLVGGVDALEVGHSFSLATTRVLRDGRYYIKDFPAGQAGYPEIISIYPNGGEGLSGPIQRVLIPVNNGVVTGAETSFTVNAATDLFNPADGIAASTAIDNVNNNGFTAYFATNQYAQLLNGKRILGINLLYSVATTNEFELANVLAGNGGIISSIDLVANNSAVFTLALLFGSTTSGLYNFGYKYFPTATASSDPQRGVTRNRLPNYNPYFGSPPSTAISEVQPWSYADLQRFEISDSSRYGIRVWNTASGTTSTTFNPSFFWYYMALEVLFCEETRLAVGGFQRANTAGANFVPIYNANVIPLRTMGTRTVNPVLLPGDYTVTVMKGDSGETSDFNGILYGVKPEPINAIRQLYPLPTVEGVRVQLPNPMNDTAVGKVFTRETTQILPMLSLHTSGGPLTEVHVYGRQSVAQVYGTITATQDINEDADGGVSYDYDQVRFYARRFGNTSVPLLLDSPDIAGFSARILPVTFDALEDMVDGWKEITLPVSPSAVPMGAQAVASPSWRWSAAGELAGNRWEVLGASAPSLSGQPGNLLNLMASGQRLGDATYGIGSTTETGTTITESWVPGIAPPVSATTADGFSDATVLFSVNPPAVSGLAVTAMSQALTYTTPNCSGFVPGCVPTSLTYNKLSWTLRRSVVQDLFARVAASGWGSADTGQAWALTGTTGLFTVDGSYGEMFHTGGAVSTLTQALVGINSPDSDGGFSWLMDATDSTGTNTIEILARYADVSNFYRVTATINANQTIDFSMTKRVAGVETTLVTQAAKYGLVQTTATWFSMRFRVAGATLQAKIWVRDLPEPPTWDLDIRDTSLTTGNSWGVRSADNTTGPAFTFFVDNLLVSPPNFGILELQRYDPVDAAFNTIMLSTTPAITAFNDYEARVGQTSVYRMRERNMYDFAGLWSPQVSGSVATPGVVGASVALTIFTTNYFQSGSSNLAYSAEWEGQPQEDFTWPESNDLVIQEMYDKNFVTTFHPLERGGERFTRNILVNAAGIPPVTSQNGFESLRDMAWNVAPYICVRDELGNRWYSTVVVPEGNRRRIRAQGHLTIAQVAVIETSEFPFPVNPA